MRPAPTWLLFALALFGLVAAHAANNMINDYFDLEGGVDSEDYVRAQYAPHPVLSGLISKKGLLLAIALVNLLDLVILLVLADARGPTLAVSRCSACSSPSSTWRRRSSSSTTGSASRACSWCGVR